MNVFDKDKYTAVGIVSKSGFTNHAHINCIGMVDRETHQFTYIPEGERSTVFPPNGRIFAHNFINKYDSYINECVCIGAIANDKEDIRGRDEFVWNKYEETYIYAKKLPLISSEINEDGQYNIDLLKKYEITESDNKKDYFVSSDRLYLYKKDCRLMQYWHLNEISNSLIWYDNTPYLIQGIKIKENGVVDTTSDEQIIEWYKKRILSKTWGTICETKDFNVAEKLIAEELLQLNLPKNIFESRLERFLNINANLALTIYEVLDLSESPWFSEVIDNSIKLNSQAYIEHFRRIQGEEIKRIEADTKSKIAEAKANMESAITNYSANISEKNEELASLQKEILRQRELMAEEIASLDKKIQNLKDSSLKEEATLKNIESRKESILKDFSIIKDVLSIQAGTSTDTRSTVNIESFLENDGLLYDDIRPYRKNLSIYLKHYCCHKIKYDNIIAHLSSSNILLLPDINTIYATMHATNNCKYVVEYVSAGWKSFSDLWDNGLNAIVQSAYEDPKTVHFLVLRNINLSYIPSYLQPVLDMNNNLLCRFPGTSLPFPRNLKILCTRTKDTVIPISESTIEGIGCIGIEEELSIEDRTQTKESLTAADYINARITDDAFRSARPDTTSLLNSIADYLDD